MRRGPVALGALTTISFALSIAPSRADVICDLAISATMVDSISSAHSYPGERFRFMTTEPSTFGDVDIPKGTEGFGVVRYVQPARWRNRSGLLILEPRFILIGESRIAVMADPRETPEFAHAMTMIEKGMGFIPMGMIGTAINTVRKGSNVTLGPGFNFHVIVMGDIITREPCRPKRGREERRQSSPSPSPSPEQT